LREQLGLVRLRFFRNHVVICGLGQKGAVLAAAFRDQGFQVVAIERNPKIDAVAEVRRHGVVVLEGSATSGILLRRARVAKAGFLVSVCGQDTLNAEVAAVAHRLVRERKVALCAFIHIADLDLGMLGCNGIVGGGIGITAGAALSAKLRGTDQVSVGFFGDGAANTGIAHEAMNLAAAWQLPAIFICENNQYALSMPYAKAVAAPDIASRAVGYGMPGEVVDGNDAQAVANAVAASPWGTGSFTPKR
jgi:hypothetical protein